MDAKVVINRYIAYRVDDKEGTDALFCTSIGISLSMLKEIKRDFPNWAKETLEKRRKKYSERISKVDEALLRAAEAGDCRAADLVYRRFDGWDPKIVNQENHFYNFADLAKGLREDANGHNKSQGRRRNI